MVIPPSDRTFKIDTSHNTLVKANPFCGLPNEDPNLFITKFKCMCNTIHNVDVTPDVIRLNLIQFAFDLRAELWFNSLPSESIRSWDEFVQVFMRQYLPPSKMA